ncbi:MAG: hypothetical protein MUP97_00900 [Acidimicrobiia bacterium]|nr:hypothetical protein [Acidimicrobiia bacterium]
MEVGVQRLARAVRGVSLVAAILVLVAGPAGVAGADLGASRQRLGCVDEEPADPDLAPLCPAKAKPAADEVLRMWRDGKLSSTEAPAVPYERVKFVRCFEVGNAGTVACRYRRVRDGARVVVRLLADEYGAFDIANLNCVKAAGVKSQDCEGY